MCIYIYIWFVVTKFAACLETKCYNSLLWLLQFQKVHSIFNNYYRIMAIAISRSAEYLK